MTLRAFSEYFRFSALLVAFAAVLMAACPARAQVAGVGSCDDGPPGALTHAWFVIGDEASPGGLVAHVPPRHRRDAMGVGIGAPAGSVRFTTDLRTTPVALAAQEHRLYMAFEESSPGFPLTRGRTVLSIYAEAAGDTWVTLPTGRLDAHPSLRGDGRLLGMAASRAGVFALMHGLVQEGADPERVELLRMTATGWESVGLPDDLQSLSRACTETQGGRKSTVASWVTFGVPRGVGVLAVPPAEVGLAPQMHILEWSGGEESSAPAVWRGVDVTGVIPVDAALGDIQAMAAAGHLIVCHRTGAGAVNIASRPLTGGIWRAIAAIPEVPTGYAAAALDSDDRLVLLWSTGERVKGASPDSPTEKMVAEVSLRTGRVVFFGEFGFASPISRADYRLMAALMVYVLGMVLVFLARTADESTILIPEGTSLAEPGRRFIAGIVDFVLASVIASRVWDASPWDVLSADLWTDVEGQALVVTLLAVLVGLNTILEWLFGRSIGKLLVGCEVVSVAYRVDPKADPAAWRPALFRCFIRNMIKWGLPPVALVGLMTLSGRHRADAIARTAVVIPGEPEEPGSDDE